MARPKKSAAEKLTKTARARMTEADYETLLNNASAAGLSEGEYIRRACLGQVVTPVAAVADPLLIVALNRIGNNVNQLARAVHVDAAFQQHWQEIGGQLQAVLAQVLRSST